MVLLRLVCYSSAWPSNGSVFLKIHTSIWIGQIGWTRSNCHSLLSIFISFSLLFNIRIWLNKHNDRVRLHILIRLNVLGFVIVSFSFYLSAYLSVLFASSLLFFFVRFAPITTTTFRLYVRDIYDFCLYFNWVFFYFASCRFVSNLSTAERASASILML